MNAGAVIDKDLDLVHWLAKMLSTNSCPGLKMIANEEGTFTIPWLNEKCGGLRSGADDTLFIQAWARHKNYPCKFGDEMKDLIYWKSNFRNSLNSWVKRRQNIRKLKCKKLEGFMVCQFEENFFKNNFTSSQVDGEAHINSGNVLSDAQITVCREMTPEMRKQNTLDEFINEPVIPVLEISVRYGIPHSEVKTFTLTNENPVCRLFYPSCTNAGVQQYLRNDGNLLHIDLPSVEYLPEFSANQKKNILSILDELDRGIYVWYHSDDIYVERRCQTKIFVDSHILQNENIPRRATRKDTPKFVKVFDYQKFISHLTLSENEKTQPKHDVRFTFGESTILYQQFLMSHVQVVVTHIQAFKDMDNIVNRNGFDLQIKSSEADDLDRLIEVLDTASCNEHGTADSSISPVLDTASCNEHGTADSSISPVLEAASILEKENDFFNNHPTAVSANTIPANHFNLTTSTQSEDKIMMIEVFCGRPSQLVDKLYASHTQPRCRIFSGPEEIQMSSDNFNKNDEVTISLPSIVDTSVKDAEKMNTILRKLRRGIHLKYENGDIYVERRCYINVYFTDGGSCSTLIPRRDIKETQEKYIHVFDINKFRESVIQFKQNPLGQLPSHEFKLTIGHEINIGSKSPLMNVLLHVSVCHLPALQHLYQTFGNPVKGFDPLLSNPDSMDRILKIVKDFSK